MGRDIVCLANYSAIQVKNLGHRVCQKVVVYGMPFTKIAVFTCDIKQEPSDKKSFHKSNNGKTTPLVPKKAKTLLVKSRHEPCTNLTDEIQMESLNSKKVDYSGITL